MKLISKCWYEIPERKVRIHGVCKRRTWRKLHLGVDEGSGEILAAVVTTNDVADCEVISDLLEQINLILNKSQAMAVMTTLSREGVYFLIHATKPL